MAGSRPIGQFLYWMILTLSAMVVFGGCICLPDADAPSEPGLVFCDDFAVQSL